MDVGVIKSVCGLSILLAVIMCITAVPLDNNSKNLRVRILHVNDMHSRFEEESENDSENIEWTPDDNKTDKYYGGFARLATYVRNAKKSGAADKLCTLFLAGGSTYQGSSLFIKHKWRIVAKLLNMLQPDIMGLGVNDFDDGVSGLVPFLNASSFPIVASNLDLTMEPSLQESTMLIKAMSLRVGNNTKIGIVGYITPYTRDYSFPGNNIKFLDEVNAIRSEARKLKSDGCTTIIALGHSSFDDDKKIAKEVEEVDLVIGGNSYVLLHNGEAPSVEKIEGPYPTVVEQPDGKKVYVVQAYGITKYIGDLMLEIDEKGRIVKAEGNTFFLDETVPKAEDIDKEIKRWKN